MEDAKKYAQKLVRRKVVKYTTYLTLFTGGTALNCLLLESLSSLEDLSIQHTIIPAGLVGIVWAGSKLYQRIQEYQQYEPQKYIERWAIRRTEEFTG